MITRQTFGVILAPCVSAPISALHNCCGWPKLQSNTLYSFSTTPQLISTIKADT